jgi:ABC-2 type transport system ATP-binding protein
MPPADPTAPVIVTTGLSRSFGEVRAVDGVDLNVAPGEMFGLVGPDGAGKSTIIRMLCGILTPDSGTGVIFGKDIVRDREALKADLGYLSQKFTLYGDLSVDENIEFFAELHRVPDYHALREQLLEFTQLVPFRDRLADKLSGGMKQKLALICTLIHHPRIIFLDEPTTGVDPVSRRELWGLLQKLNSDGMTVILCTPYLDEAERCERVAFLHDGRLMQVDTPLNLKKLIPGLVVEIVCDEPRRALGVLRAKGAFPQAQVFGDRVKVIVSGEHEADNAVTILEAASIGITSRRFVRPSLEDVFIYLMRDVSKSAATGPVGA